MVLINSSVNDYEVPILFWQGCLSLKKAKCALDVSLMPINFDLFFPALAFLYTLHVMVFAI